MNLTLTELKEFLNITGDAENNLLNSLITRSESFIESYCNLKINQTLTTEYQDGGYDDLILNHRPLIDIVSITDTENDLIIDSSNYTLYEKEGIISFLYGNWAKGKRKWKIDYNTGFINTPEDIKQAQLFIISHWYSNRNPMKSSESIGDYSYTLQAEGIPLEVKIILSKYKEVSF